MRESDIFVLSSRFEGFPNALLEAMACHLAVASFDCRSGPAEIIRHNVDGLLVPPKNVGALAEAIGQLMADSALRSRLGNQAGAVVRRFSMESIMGRWEALIDGLVNPASKQSFLPAPRINSKAEFSAQR
jgi:GalNAc-alpha-(1->4)-GalNAc-alpha-(1->3)-diNAcBac-PP-undecaprenol alpha-1,4-N-acetyl-D-galactosaminyltransferase